GGPVRGRKTRRRPGTERRRDGGRRDSAGGEGRHRLRRRHEAGDARVRGSGRGAAVRERGGSGSGRHANGRVRLPRLTARRWGQLMRRSDQRPAAVFALYAREVRGGDVDDSLDDAKPFTRELIAGVEEHQPELDEEIALLARGWELDRIAA